MMNTSLRQAEGVRVGRVAASSQVDLVLKVLLSILANPTIKAQELAKVLDVHTNTIARLLMKFREAGVNIEYDFEKQRYDIDLSKSLKDSILGKFARDLSRVLAKSDQRQAPIKFVSSLENYTIKQFAQMIGTSPSNVYNMCIGYKGQVLPQGYVAYQMSERTKWRVMKMTTDRSGKTYSVPDVLKDAFRIVKGSGAAVDSRNKVQQHCIAITKDDKGKKVACPDDAVLKGYCTTHYFQQRRRPDRFFNKELKDMK